MLHAMFSVLYKFEFTVINEARKREQQQGANKFPQNMATKMNVMVSHMCMHVSSLSFHPFIYNVYQIVWCGTLYVVL